MPFYVHSVGITSLNYRETRLKHGFRNPFVELMWSLSGTGEIAGFGRNYPMRPGEVCFFLPGEDHLVRAISRHWTYRWLCIDGPLAEAVFFSFKLPRHFRAAGPVPEEWFAELEKLVSCSDRASLGRAAGLVLAIYGGVLPQAEADAPDTPEQLPERCVKYIEARFSDPAMSVQQLADALATSPVTLTRRFRAAMKCSPGDYLQLTRLRHAQTLLTGTLLPVRAIAKRCGYLRPASFCRAFRRRFGLTPEAFRRQISA